MTAPARPGDRWADVPEPHDVVLEKPFMKNEAWFNAIENALLQQRT